MTYAILAVLAGAAVSLQGVVNAQLRGSWGLMPTMLLNALLSTAPILLFWLARGANLPTREQVAATPAVLLVGGLLGVVILVAGALVFTRLGATLALGFILAGQFLAAAAVDHFGLLGMDARPLTPTRLTGLALLAVAVWLLKR